MKNNLEKGIRAALEKGRKNWIKFVESLDNRKITKFYCNLYNCRFGSNYTDEYILRGRSPEAIREELMNMNHSEEMTERLAQAIIEYENQESNYSFSYVTGLGYPDDVLFDPPSLDWLATPEGYSWACYHL